jgi:iron complex transport system substrate-binding protein
MAFPKNIICLTEESVETLYLLGRSDLIAGISQYVERPPGARERHPVVTQFVRSDVEQISAQKPDLVIGFSDIQKDIARELIGRGLNVLITNQRSLQEILDYILFLGRIVGEEDRARELVAQYQRRLAEYRTRAQTLGHRPRVYFEEWDVPRLSGIRWVSELIEAVGGVNVFAHKTGSLAREREVTDAEILTAAPEVIFACWCGKPVQLQKIQGREGYSGLPAVRNQRISELSPAVFLQPGPALFEAGLEQMSRALFPDLDKF